MTPFLEVWDDFVLTGFFKTNNFYRILMVRVALFLGCGSVLNHFNLVRDIPESYHSIAALGKFKT
ncbi:MAG: hypothetical protein AB8B69_03435 [Chitinophagales bacterium]